MIGSSLAVMIVVGTGRSLMVSPKREYFLKYSEAELKSLVKEAELKSLKYYMQSYRNKGIFYEALTNDILDYLSSICKPRHMKITSSFTPRGGISTEVVAQYKKET